MAKESFQIDPEAVVYSDDEIVGKVNSATANINRANAVESAAVDLSGKDADDLAESVTKKYAGVSGADFKKSVDTLEEITEGATKKHFTDTEKTKLTGVEENAKDDQSGAEVRDAILGLADVDRKIIVTDPQSGEKPVLALQRDADGKLDIDNDDQPMP